MEKKTFKDDAAGSRRHETRTDNASERRAEWKKHFFDFINENPHLLLAAAQQVAVPEVKLDRFMPSSAGSVAQRFPVDYITEDTPCSLHVPIGRSGHSKEAARGIAIPGDLFHMRPIPDEYTKVQVTEITNNRFINDPLDFPMVDEGIETIGDALNNFVLWASRDIHLLGRQSPLGSPNIPSQSPTYPPPRDVQILSQSPVHDRVEEHEHNVEKETVMEAEVAEKEVATEAEVAEKEATKEAEVAEKEARSEPPPVTEPEKQVKGKEAK